MFCEAFIGDIATQRITHSRRIKVVEPHLLTHLLMGGVFEPIYGISFFSYFGDLIPSMAVGAAFGPIVQFINFQYAPLMYQLLYVNMFCLLDSAFMS
ncbi:hypothetical protein MKX01_000351 [Papaver californicum]|nr:hypothetical protein MKX01_000351 [Papaver californicum]